MSEYETILTNLEKLRRNYNRAQERNDTGRMKQYQNRINELELQKAKLEQVNSPDILKKQEEMINKLTEQIKGQSETITKLNIRIDDLKNTITTVQNATSKPISEQPKEENQPKKCPNCGQFFTPEKMVEHQHSCLASRQ